MPSRPGPPPVFQQLMQWTPLILIGLVMYLVVFRGKQTEQKKRQDMLGQLKRGDEIQTIGGEIGKVVEVREDRVLVKVDESNNTKVWYTRNAIHRVIEADKVEAK